MEPPAAALAGPRLDLEPLRVEHAEELVGVLADERLHTFTGGRPPTLDRLRAQYAAQVRGRSADGSRCWLNWVVRRRADGVPVGYVQATVFLAPDPVAEVAQVADLAWVIGTAFQGRGYAVEAAGVMAGWLRGQGVTRLEAFVHPAHRASAAVARRLGLTPTAELVDGETRWTG